MEKTLEEWYKLHKFYLYMDKYRTKDLADYLKVNTRTIQRWLLGKGSPNEEKINKIKQYLTSKEFKNEEL